MSCGGSRPGSGVQKGTKRGPYTTTAATKKRSKPSNASTAMLASFVVRGNDDEAPQDGHDGGAPAAAAQHLLQVDDKSSIHANHGGANWQLAADMRGTLPLPPDHDHGMLGR